MAKDILTDENRDFLTKNGDFVIDYSDEQHIEDVIVAEKGWYKETPILGVGIMRYLKGPKTLIERMRLEKDIDLQLQIDGATNIILNNTDEQLNVVGDYE